MPTHETSATSRHIDGACRITGYVIAFAILIGGVLVDQLLARRREEMNDRRVAADVTAAQADAADIERETLTLKRTEATGSLDVLKGRLTKSPQESLFNANLAEAAAASGMKIESFRPGQRSDSNGFGELDVQISCRGTYAAHCDFLERLRDFSRVCPVGGMRITSADESGSNLQSEFQIRLIYGDAEQGIKVNTQGTAR